jgi:hypothetical protein
MKGVVNYLVKLLLKFSSHWLSSLGVTPILSKGSEIVIFWNSGSDLRNLFVCPT